MRCLPIHSKSTAALAKFIRHNVIIAVVLAAILPRAIHAQPAMIRADEQFLRQLTERLFFDLAAEHCQRELENSTDIEERALWQLRLCRTYDQHAWFAESASRGGLLNQSIQRLADFLKQNQVSPETEFDLRLQQIRTLIQSVRIAIIQSEAGHLFGKPATAVSTRMPPQHAITVDRAIELTETLATRLEQLRRDLDTLRARNIRDASRLALVELKCLRFQLRNTPTSSTTSADRNACETLINQTIRSARTQEQKHRARWLLAELSLVAGDDQQFQLRIGAATRQVNKEDLMVAELLQIRNLLRNQEATAAFKLAVDTMPRTALQTQQLQWLKLEAALGRFELASQLNDIELKESTESAFKALLTVTRRSSTGVLHDAVEAVATRHALVLQVGVEVADLVEQIDRENASGNAAHALSLLEHALNSLPANGAVRARAALSLRAGEIHIGRQEWHAARKRLKDATTFFASEKMVPQQAIADLLRVYTLAQTWAEAAAVEQKNLYVAALEQHIRQFSEQTTANRAREWLFKVQEADNPQLATVTALDQFDFESNAEKRITALRRAAELLSALGANIAASSPKLVKRFHKCMKEVMESKLDGPRNSIGALQLCALEFELADKDVGNTNWAVLGERFRNAADGLPHIAELTSDRLRWTLLNVIIEARIATHPERLADAEQQLRNIPAESKTVAAAFLAHQLGNEEINVGDVSLARVTQQIIAQILDDPSTADRDAMALKILPLAVRSSNITGKTNQRNRILESLLSGSITDQQLADVVRIISDAADNSIAGVGTNPATLTTFWTDVLRGNKQGSEPWLEASVQLAAITAKAGKQFDALRQLDVIEILYPEWGTPGRKTRATNLRQSLR